jgi:hypothetical protein
MEANKWLGPKENLLDGCPGAKPLFEELLALDAVLPDFCSLIDWFFRDSLVFQRELIHEAPLVLHALVVQLRKGCQPPGEMQIEALGRWLDVLQVKFMLDRAPWFVLLRYGDAIWNKSIPFVREHQDYHGRAKRNNAFLEKLVVGGMAISVALCSSSEGLLCAMADALATLGEPHAVARMVGSQLGFDQFWQPSSVRLLSLLVQRRAMDEETLGLLGECVGKRALHEMGFFMQEDFRAAVNSRGIKLFRARVWMAACSREKERRRLVSAFRFIDVIKLVAEFPTNRDPDDDMVDVLRSFLECGLNPRVGVQHYRLSVCVAANCFPYSNKKHLEMGWSPDVQLELISFIQPFETQWTCDIHRTFPETFRVRVKALLLVNARLGHPIHRDCLSMICQRLARLEML